MKEKEILDRMKDLIHTCDYGIAKHGEYDDLYEKDKQAIEGIMKLYDEEKHKLKINGTIEDVSAMIVSAVRYAIGRRTYIVSWTCDFVEKNLNLITDKDKRVIIKDLKSIAEYGYGDDCDKADWLRLLEILNSKVNSNEE